MGQMNRSLNLPQIQRIMNEFERESATMDMKEELMSDAVDDAMEDEEEGEGEEAEGDKILKEVLDEIGMNMNDAVRVLLVTDASSPLRQPQTPCRMSLSCRPASLWLRAVLDLAPMLQPPRQEAAARMKTTCSAGWTCCARIRCRMY